MPDELLQQITSREPYRSIALADAKMCCYPQGIGLEVIVPDEVVFERFDHWEHSVARLPIDVNWSEDITGYWTTGYLIRLERVALEDGRWRIVQVMDDAARAEAEETLRMIREMRSRGQL